MRAKYCEYVCCDRGSANLYTGNRRLKIIDIEDCKICIKFNRIGEVAGNPSRLYCRDGARVIHKKVLFLSKNALLFDSRAECEQENYALKQEAIEQQEKKNWQLIQTLKDKRDRLSQRRVRFAYYRLYNLDSMFFKSYDASARAKVGKVFKELCLSHSECIFRDILEK